MEKCLRPIKKWMRYQLSLNKSLQSENKVKYTRAAISCLIFLNLILIYDTSLSKGEFLSKNILIIFHFVCMYVCMYTIYVGIK